MFDQNISFKIKTFLTENADSSYKLRDLAKLLRIGKHKHKDLIDTLFALVREKQIILKNRRYSAPKTIRNRNNKSADSYKTSSNRQLKTGTFDATSLARNKSYAFVISDQMDIFVSAEDTLTAFHQDKVEVELRYSRNGKMSGIITRVLERARDKIVGVIREYHNKYYLIPDNSKIHTNFMVNEMQEAVPGLKTVLLVTNWGNRELQKLPAGDVVEVLGKAGDPEVEILSVIRQYDLPLNFPDQVLSELEQIDDEISEEEINRRTDLRELPTITIDPASAKDFDDAISLHKRLDGYDLYVHIADVAHYISINSELFKEAARRGNSFYFPKTVIPMLPEKISNKICSLRPFEQKLTLTVLTKFDRDYRITSQKVFESIIESNARFSYEEIDDLFDQKKTDITTELTEMLHEMRKLSVFLLAKRIKQGYLNFELPETEYIFDDDGHIADLQRSRETDSHKMIENFMLIANEFTARELSNKPTIYRIHEIPEEEKLQELADIMKRYEMKLNLKQDYNQALQQLLQSMPNQPYHRVFDRLILRSLKRARYSVDNAGHFGLAMDIYTHFTSPIRRLCDLIVHHQIKAKLAKQQETFSGKQLYDHAGIASEQEKIADEAEREVDLKNKLIFMKKYLGEEFKGIIVGMKSTGMIIELDRFPVTGLIDITTIKDDYYEFNEQYRRFIGRSKGNIYKLTDVVTVLVSKVDNDIYFQLKIDNLEQK